MIIRIFSILIFSLTFVAPVCSQGADSVLLSERMYYYNKYSSIADTMTINSWINLKRLKDNLEEVVKIDNELIQYYQVFGSREVLNESDSINRLNSKLSEVSNQLELKTSRADNDLWMIWILKTAAVFMIFIILILIYLAINFSNKFKNARIQVKSSEDENNSLKEEYLQLVEECKRLKSREDDFREELQRGLISNQEKLNLLQEKIKSLEFENEKLRAITDSNGFTQELYLEKDEIVLNEPNIDDLTIEEITNLVSERNSLIRLAGKLQDQLLFEKEAHLALKKKLLKLLDK
jgi:hypothetical protein